MHVAVYERAHGPRRPRRRVRLRRPPGRPLLPRRPADGRSRPRARGRARPRRSVPLPADRRRLLRRRAALLDELAAKEFLTFPLLPLHDRVRLAAFVARCQPHLDRATSSTTSRCSHWLTKLCGRRTVERLWQPLLDSKFDGNYDDLPATYIWAPHEAHVEDARRKRPRDHGLARGRLRDADRRARRARSRSSAARSMPASRVDQVAGSADAASTGSSSAAGCGSSITCSCTLLPPLARRLLAPALAEQAPADHCRYLGVICVLLRTSRSVSPYYTLNITDRRIPLTTVVETTHVVDPASRRRAPRLRGEVRRPVASRPEAARPKTFRPTTSATCARSSPTFATTRSSTSSSSARRPSSRCTRSAARRACRTSFPVPGLALASTAHVYPEIVNGQAVIGVADRVVGRDPRAASRRTGGGRVTSAAFPAPRLAALRSAVVDRPGRRRRARPPLRGARRPDLGRLGRPRPGHGLRPCSPARGSRTASCRTSTSSTTTARSPRSLLGLAAWIGGAGVGSAVAVGLAISVRHRRPDLRARARPTASRCLRPSRLRSSRASPSRRPTSVSSSRTPNRRPSGSRAFWSSCSASAGTRAEARPAGSSLRESPAASRH